jgi:hypothetical protein
LTLKSIDDIERGDGLSLGVFRVGDCIADDAFKEDLEDTSSFFVDEAGDTLDTTTASKTADSGLCDSLCLLAHDMERNIRMLSRKILR